MIKIFLIVSLAFLGQTLNSYAQLPSYVPTSGLVGWWPFNGNANDESGNGNNGTVTGATLTSDRYLMSNKAYEFNTTNNGTIRLPFPVSIENEFSIIVWVRADRSINFVPVSDVCPSSVDVSLAFTDQNWVINPQQEVDPAIGGGGLTVGTNGVMTAEHGLNILVPRHSYQNNLSGFQCIAIVYRLDSTFLFINGNPVDSKAIHCPTTPKKINEELLLGGNLYSPTFSGVIDDIGLWNRALNPSEINLLFESSSKNVGINVENPKRSLHVKDIIRLEPRNSEPSNPVEGDIYFDGIIKKLRVFDGTQWKDCW